MLINRNNYEDFFLLYADDELLADERKAVEDFIAENEDLRVELDLIIASVLPMEEIPLADKSFLYKEIIFDASIHEKLLLKLDNELAVDELNTVDSLITNNEILKNEYNLLATTKLDSSEKIVFEDKHLLYKRERDNVVIFRFARWAAAAILIGFVVLLGEKFFNNRTTSNSGIAIIQPKGNGNNSTQIVTNTDNISTVAPDVIKEQNNVATIEETKEKSSSVSKRIISGKESKIKTNTVIVKDEVPSDKQNELALLNKVQIEIDKNATKSNDVGVPEMDLVKNPSIAKLATKDDKIIPLENTYKQALSFTEMEKSENKILYMDEDDVKRTKVGGFFRKVKRFVERTAKIKTGNNIQIAGFEIAAK